MWKVDEIREEAERKGFELKRVPQTCWLLVDGSGATAFTDLGAVLWTLNRIR